VGAKKCPIKITASMVVAGTKRMRESLDESQQSSADAWLVLEILETALAARRGGAGNSIAEPLKLKILADSLQRL
jgi:hypothetical protein